MRVSLIVLLALFSLVGNAQTKALIPGENAPVFKLKNVDEKAVSFESYPNAKAYIVVFTCNTCPYAKGYEQRIIDINNKYSAKRVPVIAINPNDPEASPGDSFAKMQEQAKSKGYKFPYLFDENQTITNAYGASKTPQVFLAQKTNSGFKIIYTGGIDDDPEGTSPLKVNYLDDAVEALLAGNMPAIAQTKAIGCSVKRKK